MAFEYVIGPVIAFVLSAKFTIYLNKKSENQIAGIRRSLTLRDARIEKVEAEMNQETDRLAKIQESIEVIDKQTLAKMVTTMQPVASALKEIQSFVGLR